mmetsp:Transcript_38904/g.69660  ORF Transcript_38904/g.69660 Transcript_38904/m.69660 type:complete len:214 (+) Transcript_38904:6308-6949(+)
MKSSAWRMNSAFAARSSGVAMATKVMAFSSPKVRYAHRRMEMMHFAAAMPLLAISTFRMGRLPPFCFTKASILSISTSLAVSTAAAFALVGFEAARGRTETRARRVGPAWLPSWMLRGQKDEVFEPVRAVTTVIPRRLADGIVAWGCSAALMARAVGAMLGHPPRRLYVPAILPGGTESSAQSHKTGRTDSRYSGEEARHRRVRRRQADVVGS